MRNKEKEKHNIIIGAIIGGIIGGGALYLLSSSRDKPVLNKIGRAISEMGEILEEGAMADSGESLDEIEKNIPNGAVLNDVLSWVATGITLWKKFKKGS